MWRSYWATIINNSSAQGTKFGDGASKSNVKRRHRVTAAPIQLTSPSCCALLAGILPSVQRRVLTVPIRMRLVPLGGRDHGIVVQHLAEELNADRQPSLGKPTRNALRRQAAQIADPADRIGERQGSFQVGIEGGRTDRERGRDQYVELLEDCVHLLLKNAADALCPNEVLGRYRLCCVAPDTAQWIAELGNFSRFDQLGERGSSFDVDHDSARGFEWPFRQLHAADGCFRLLQHCDRLLECGGNIRIGFLPCLFYPRDA